jgi:hypothetical protein
MLVNAARGKNGGRKIRMMNGIGKILRFKAKTGGWLA